MMRIKQRVCCWLACLLSLATAWCGISAAPPARNAVETPQAADSRLRVDLFAASPDIVHPIGVAFDRRGRLLVIESHTHFRPGEYKGPRHDRIRVLEDTDGDGKADRFTTFYEATDATMGIAVHPDGSVYLATRNEILRLRDTGGTGKASECRRIIFLETKARYPHNGLSGLAFDFHGDLIFGMGENEGSDYKLIGADGTTLIGGGEGGNIYRCTADGHKLRRMATGFWNPFGIAQDIFGRVFALDNDPDAMPPCRMVHVVEGGDYGYQYRYGRSGRHPFQCWNGQLPGTLPMVSGVGEAPCQLLAYESDGLPGELRGSLLVASWADHRVERYELHDRGASVRAERRPFVQGGKDFRPVGIAVAPDGSLFVSDWVRSDYNLHGKGAIWHIRPRHAATSGRPTEREHALLSADRSTREEAAHCLAASNGRPFLHKQLGSADVRVRATSLLALIEAGDESLDLAKIARTDAALPLRALAVRALVDRHVDCRDFLGKDLPPAVRLEAVRSLKDAKDRPQLLGLLSDPDPFLRNAAIEQLKSMVLAEIDVRALTDPGQRVGILLAWYRHAGERAMRVPVEKADVSQAVRTFLADADEDVRFMAAKWIADQKLEPFRPQLVGALQDPRLNLRLCFAYSAALARLDGREGNEAEMADLFFARLRDRQTPLAARVQAVQMIPPAYKPLTPELLGELLAGGEPPLQLEAARALSDIDSPKKVPLLRAAASNGRLGDEIRAQALLGLTGEADKLSDELVGLAQGKSAVLRDEALRGLVHTRLNPAQRSTLEEVSRKEPATAALVARALGQPFVKDRPAAGDLEAWLKRLEGPADSAAGRRIFFHPMLAGCYHCHRAEGRGQEVGPDLNTVGRSGRRHILESILQPSVLVAPHYQTWQVETSDGKVRTGLLVRTVLDDYTYLDAKGAFFRVNTRDVVDSRPIPQSIMPDGLVDQLTDQEMRDLLAYLESRR
jgi:putative membrane-bound dehydrogenase-like protein